MAERDFIQAIIPGLSQSEPGCFGQWVWVVFQEWQFLNIPLASTWVCWLATIPAMEHLPTLKPSISPFLPFLSFGYHNWVQYSWYTILPSANWIARAGRCSKSTGLLTATSGQDIKKKNRMRGGGVATHLHAGWSFKQSANQWAHFLHITAQVCSLDDSSQQETGNCQKARFK